MVYASCRIDLITMHRWKEDPYTGRRQRRFEAVLEIPQREHPQEILPEIKGRLLRLQKTSRTTDSSSVSTSTETIRGCQAIGGEGCARGRRGRRTVRVVWRFGPIRRPIVVPRCKLPQSQYHICKTNSTFSTTPPTSTKHMLPSAQKSGNGSLQTSNHLLANGTRLARSPMKSTKLWAHEATSLG
jgi:hypothetical protein